jgi:two-component system nitrogen regulation response regulator GlnG
LENTARWLTVMASGREIHCEDLPPELQREGEPQVSSNDWRTTLRSWIRSSLAAGKVGLLDQAMPEFETIMIETALEFTGGRKQDAARLLGWGRNTLTRKIKELGLESEHREAG